MAKLELTLTNEEMQSLINALGSTLATLDQGVWRPPLSQWVLDDLEAACDVPSGDEDIDRMGIIYVCARGDVLAGGTFAASCTQASEKFVIVAST